MSLVRNFIRVSNQQQRKDEERKKREKQSGASRSAPKPASKPAPKPTPKPAAIGTKPAGIVGSAAIKHAALSASKSAMRGAQTGMTATASPVKDIVKTTAGASAAAKSAMRGAQQSQSIKPISVQGGGQSFGSISKNARAAAPKRMGAVLPDARTAPARVVQPSASGLPEGGQNGKGGGQRISDLLITGGFPSAPSGSQPGTQAKWYEQSGQGGLQSAQPGAQSGADRQNGIQPVRVAQPSASGLPKEYDRQEDKPVGRPDASRQNAGSNKLLSNILMTGGFANQTFPGAQPPVSLEQAEMNAKQRAERVNQALISGNWQEFAPTDGSSYKIVRPDDATLLGEAPTGPELLLGALSRAGAGGFGSEQWRERTEGVGLAFDNADGVASVQADAQAQGMAAPDARREAINASMHAAAGGALPYITGQQGDSADRRAAREQADERWQGIVDSYVSQTPFYTENKARIDANRAQIDAALTQTSAQLDSTPAGTPEADALARDLRLLKKARYENEHADKSLMQRARAYETDAGRLQGEVSDEDRLRFGLSENIESDGTPLGDALANLARARFAGSADFLRYAKGKVRSVCNVITTVQAAAQGYDNVYDYLESTDGAAEIMGEWAFDPTSQMDYAHIDFGGESWNKAQEISQRLFQNTMDMSLMHFGGGGIFASLAFQAPDSFAAASNEALEYGASTQDMLTSGTIVAAVETVMGRYGFDRLENAAGSVFSGLTPSLRKLLPEGLKQISKSPWARTLLNVLSAGVGEGFEEVGEYAIEGLTRRFVYDNTSEWWGEEGIFDPHEMLVEGGWGAAMGSLFTVTAGLGMDKGSASYELASDVLERAGTNRPFDAQLEELRATLPADAASHEHTAADVQAHAELWSARGQDVPQSYDAWLDAAQQADAAQAAYGAARGSMAQLVERAQAGELDPATPENAQIWQKAMQNMTDAEDALRTAAQRNVDARTAYMADEGAELDSIAAKHDALEEISGEIQAAIKDAADGRAQDARTLDVPEIRNAAEAVKNARLAELSAQGDADAATIALRSADGPDAIIAAKQDVEAAQARVASAQQAAESAKAELRRAAMEQTDFDARMERGRAANEAAGRHDSRYDDMTDGELMAERERLKAIEQSSLERTDEVRGTARAARREAQEGIAARLAALDAETELRSEVYGGREYQTREMREDGEKDNAARKAARNAIDSEPTGLRFRPLAEYTRKQLDNIVAYLKSTDVKLKEIVDRFRENHNAGNVRYKISDVSDREAQDIRNLTGIDISGFEHRLNESALNHVDKRHGAKGKGNQTMTHSEDVARIGYVLANYDSIELLKKNGKPVTSYEFKNRDNSQAPIVLFKKQLDGTCYVASAVQDSKRRIMWVMSAYLDNSGIKNRQPNREYPMQDYPPQVRTPEAHTRSQLSDSEAAYASSTANIIPDSSASVNASSGDLTQTAPRIYRNGTLLFAGMDEAELTSEIAREGRISQDPDPAVSEPAKERLQALRSERDTRADASEKDARRARRDAARTDRLAEIDEMIKSIPEAPDGELSRHRNYLRRQINQLTIAQEGADKATVEMYSNEIQRMRESLKEIEKEEHGRADLRRADAERMAQELAGDPARAEVEGEARDVDILEKQRIKLNQQTGHEAIEKLKAEHEAAGRKWRVTDNISLEEAVRIFDDASGMTAQGEGEAPPGGTDALLSENRAALARWEQYSEALDTAIDDMEREVDMLKRRKQRYGSGEDYSPEQIRDGMRENRLNDSISQAKALKRRAKRSIAYLQSHAGESTLDAARGGRLPEQMLERVMGMVDRLKIPKNGLISMNMNTATRVFDDLFGDEAPVMRALYTDQVARHVADMQRFTDRMRSRLSALKLDSKESELVQRFGEGLLTPDELAAEIDEQHAKRGTKLKDGSGEWTLETSLTAADDTAELNYEGYGDKADEVRRISNAAAEFADIYSELFDRINDARVRNGYEPMGKLENYFPHFLPASGGIFSRMARRMGFGGEKLRLPTSIDGLTEWRSPGKKYNVHSDKHRRGSQTEYNALEGFEEYIDAAGREIFLTDDIQRIRQLERAVRSGEEAGVLTTRQKPDKANGDFGSFAKWLHEYANLLAGKKSGIMDRGIEEMGGRVYYQAVDVLRKKRSAAAIAGSVVSAATNISPVVLVTGEHPAAAVKGLIGAVDALIHGDSGHGMPESDFLARRFGTDQLGVGMLARTARWISKPFQIFDIVSSNIVVRTNYYAGLDAGMDPESAMRCADDKAARLMADRSTGQMPNMYYSRTFMATLGQFQLEVANEIKRLSKDIPRTYGAPRATAIYGLTAIFCALANMGWKELTGRELFLDPLGSLKDGIDAGREKAEEEGPWKGAWEGIKTTAAGIGSGLPYIGGFFDGGRIGTNLLGDAWQAGGVIAEAVQAGNDGGAWDEAFWAMTNYVTYGGQFKKSYQAAGALMQNGVYDSQGRLMYPVDASDPWTRIQASVFGKSSTYYARKYWDEGRESLSAANTSTYEKLVQQGVSPVEAYEEVYAYQQATKLNGDMKDKIEEGDMEGAARLRMKRDEALRGVRYATLIPDDMAGSMGSATLDMLESAWREDMDNGFLPKAVRYNGQFTKGGVSYQFTDESMEKLQAVAQQELNRRMLTYKDEWADMSAEERAAALKTCTGGKSPSGEQVYKSSVWVYTKEYGFENGLEYMTTADYKAMHKDDKDKKYTNPNPGLTNPIADTVKALSGGFAQDGADVQTEETAAGDTVLPEVQTYTGGDTRGSGGRSGGGGRGGRGGRRGGSRRRGSGGGMTVGMPEATVTIPWHRTRLYESFGEGYNPFPLSGQFEWGGQAYNLEGEELKQYTGLYDAYMDIYMRERQDEWDAADNERRKEIYRELDERAKEAAREQFAGLY